MRRIGTVVRTPGGLAVARVDADATGANALPATATELVDEHLDTVGQVVEVMGPVDRPYVVISTAADRTGPSLVGTTCYTR